MACGQFPLELDFWMPLKVNCGIAAREGPLEDTERLNDTRRGAKDFIDK